ncbi:hypothetical protein GCM10009844_00700 [Nocardioides koreensis]|uniref:Uncharacterized protein n=1 Tax=Nocardioides koreensis TaxID=433651 RepID=A0ABN2Z1P6_9ACTN
MTAPYRIVRDGDRIVLPPVASADEGGISFSTWTDAEPALRRFCRAARKGRKRGQEWVEVEVALVHRPDNDYNRNAVSVAAPATVGADVEARHLGYLFDHYLREVGMGLIPELAGLESENPDGFIEIVCTAQVWGSEDLTLALPDGHTLGVAIVEYLDGVAGDLLPGTPTPTARSRAAAKRLIVPAGTVPESDHRHRRKVTETEQALGWVRSFAGPPAAVGTVIVSLARPARGGPRRLVVKGSSAGLLGEVVLGHLFLFDERHRADVLSQLLGAGVDAARPLRLGESDQPGLVEWPADWPRDQVPNMWTQWFPDRLELRPRDPSTGRSWTTIATYNPTTRTLWVEDSRLIAPSRVYAARVGLPVEHIGLPRSPWNLEDEIPYTDLYDVSLRPLDRDYEPDVRPCDQVVALLPDGLFPPGVPGWRHPDAAPQRTETDEEFLLLERYVTERTRLFGPLELSPTIGRCRLCGQPGVEFTALVCSEAVTYCHGCLASAANGKIRDRARAADALRRLGELEFDGAPMLEAQLDTLHIDPADPASPSLVDQLLLLRFAVRRGQFPWTLLLEEAGFAEDGLRLSRGTLIRARDGHLCQSLREKAVCDFLHQHDVAHDREPRYPADPDYNPTGLRRADWRLANGTYVEMWGLPNDPAYAAKMVAKRSLAVRHGIRLIELTDSDLPRLPAAFAAWLPPGTAAETTWTWSPVTARDQLKTREPRGDTRGNNEFNSALRTGRLDRCREAVELQREGFTRKEIGEWFDVGGETVKAMLRDGKFYADPASDPGRAAVAQAAADAKRSGLTRAQFQLGQKVSAPKAQEAWRDADVLDPQADI